MRSFNDSSVTRSLRYMYWIGLGSRWMNMNMDMNVFWLWIRVERENKVILFTTSLCMWNDVAFTFTCNRCFQWFDLIPSLRGFFQKSILLFLDRLQVYSIASYITSICAKSSTNIPIPFQAISLEQSTYVQHPKRISQNAFNVHSWRTGKPVCSSHPIIIFHWKSCW